MNAEELNTLIQSKEPEGLKIDFKAKFYDVNNPDNSIKEKQWNELIKDVLALANGNIGTAGQDGFLIIGIADKVNSSGTRDVFDVTEIPVKAKQILDKVNSFSKSQLPDLYVEPMLFQGKTIQIIRIPPSPYLYETSKPLVTSKTTYHENSVFIRRKDGIAIASTEDREFILAEKKSNKSFAKDLQVGLGEYLGYKNETILGFQSLYEDIDITDMFVQIEELFVSKFLGNDYYEKSEILNRSELFFDRSYIGKTLKWIKSDSFVERTSLKPNELAYVLFLEDVPDFKILRFGFDVTNPNEARKKVWRHDGTYEVHINVFGKVLNEITYRKRTFVVLVRFIKGSVSETENAC